MLFFGENGTLTMGCVIHDMSESGARIQIDPGADIPVDVILVHPRESMAHEAKIAWRRRGSVGLSFVATCDLKRLRERELDALRKFTGSNLPS